MARFSYKALVGGALTTFFAMSAMAGPPVIHDGGRYYGNSMGGHRCDTFGNLFRCVDVHASEHYDVKGTFQYTEVHIGQYIHRSFEDGSRREGHRWLSCPVDKDAITVHPNAATLDTVIDPAMPGCYGDGWMTEFDANNNPIGGGPWPWTGPRPVSGEWLNPLSYSKSVSHRKDTAYDGWTDTKHSSVRNCKESYGDLMQDGGFYLGINQWYYSFEGADTPGWSYFHTMSCNENNKQK